MRSPLLLAALLALAAPPAAAMETDAYRALVAQTIAAIGDATHAVDVDALVAVQERLMAIGVEGAREHALRSPADAPLMRFVIDRAPGLTALDLDAIEAQWHEGAALEAVGVDFLATDHFDRALSHMDAIVHPATAIIALRAFERTGERFHLVQVRNELAEMTAHLDAID